MKKHILMAAALVFALAGCSELETLNSSNDNKSQDTFGDKLIGAVKGHNASGKMSSKTSRANMEEIATFVDKLAKPRRNLDDPKNGGLPFSLPAGFQNLTELTNAGQSNLTFEAKFFQRLGFCTVLNVSEKAGKAVYKMVDRIQYKQQPEKPTPLPNEVLELPTCDYTMVGGTSTKTLETKKAIDNKDDIRTTSFEKTDRVGFTLTLKPDAAETNPVRMIRVETAVATGTTGINKIGHTYRKDDAKWVIVSLELVNGQRFELTAINRSQRTDTPVAVNRSFNEWNSSAGFYGAFTTPNAKLSYVWETRDASNMKEKFEKLTVNGQDIGETLD